MNTTEALREALKFYSDQKNYVESEEGFSRRPEVMFDRGLRALSALASVEQAQGDTYPPEGVAFRTDLDPKPAPQGQDARDAARFRWLCSLKSGRPESQIALAQVILSMRENAEAVSKFIDEQIAALKTGEQP